MHGGIEWIEINELKWDEMNERMNGWMNEMNGWNKWMNEWMDMFEMFAEECLDEW